jgi:signal transduction histidine kinase
MITPKKPHNEVQRQLAVEKYRLLDTMPEDSYDNITSLISNICETPICCISLIDKDRNFLKSRQGVPMVEFPRDLSFCGHAINSDQVLVIVEDTRKDERFHDNPLVTEHNAIFYAGAQLINSDGYKLGTLCVYDTKPRKLKPEQNEALLSMAKQVVSLFELHYKSLELIKLSDNLKLGNENLQKFAGVVSHDLRSPLSNIISLTQLIKDENLDNWNKETLEYLEYIKISSYALKDYIDGLLKFYKNDDMLNYIEEKIDLEELIRELRTITDTEHKICFNFSGNTKEIKANRTALLQILINLVTNGIKYNSKSNVVIDICITDQHDFYDFKVKDNGNGIPEAYLNKIFELFTIVGEEDKDGNRGTGIGLAMVKKTVESLGGKITVSSVVGEGSSFNFTLAKKM